MSNSTNKRRFFLCTGEAVTVEQLEDYPNSHVIGELRYVLDEGRKVTALARWNLSVGTYGVPPTNPDVDVYLIGDARNIQCKFPGCKHKERWEIGQAAYMQLMSRYARVTA